MYLIDTDRAGESEYTMMGALSNEQMFFFFQAEGGIRYYKVTGVSDVCSSDLPEIVGNRENAGNTVCLKACNVLIAFISNHALQPHIPVPDNNVDEWHGPQQIPVESRIDGKSAVKGRGVDFGGGRFFKKKKNDR